MTKESIYSDKAPAPIGPYSQAVKCSGNFVFVSGQLGFDNEGNFAGDDIESQTRQVCKNIMSILEAASMTAENVVKTTVFMANLADFAAMNEVYNEYFGNSKPARAAFQSAQLPKSALIEIEAIAVC